jgi:MFS transporter, Spinster family, sphingosine-1-phosphate transporter
VTGYNTHNEPTESNPRVMPSRYAVYVLALMFGINFLNYMDRWVGSAVAPLIQREFQLSDFEVGALASAFQLVYAIGAVPFGLWADRGVRKAVIGTGVAIWSAATLITGFTQNFAQLFTSRAILGIGEASYYPAGTSLLGDYFPRDLRGRVMSIWSAGTAFGIAAGFAGGGIIAAAFGWRSAFFVTAAPGLLFAFLAFRMREPLRGSAETGGPRLKLEVEVELEKTQEASLRKLLDLLRIGTLRNTILSQTALFFVLTANAYWLPTLLNRRFGMGVGEAGTLAGGVIVLGGLIGTLLGGYAADWRRKHTSRADLEVAIVGFALSAALVSIGLLAPAAWFVPIFLAAVVCLYLYSGPFTAIGQNVVVPSLRASAVTVTLLIAHLFGDSYAPAAVGLLSDAIGSLQLSLLIVSPTLLLVATGFAALALRSIHSDTSAMDREWAARTSREAQAQPLHC